MINISVTLHIAFSIQFHIVWELFTLISEDLLLLILLFNIIVSPSLSYLYPPLMWIYVVSTFQIYNVSSGFHFLGLRHSSADLPGVLVLASLHPSPSLRSAIRRRELSHWGTSPTLWLVNGAGGGAPITKDIQELLQWKVIIHFVLLQKKTSFKMQSGSPEGEFSGMDLLCRLHNWQEEGR